MANRRIPRRGVKGKQLRTTGTQGSIESENLQGPHDHVDAYGLKMANFTELQLLSDVDANYIYTPDTFDDSNNVWQDALGNANSSSVSGNPTLQNLSGQSSKNASDITKAVYFDTGDKMRWSHLTVGNNNDYTLFHVARYADSGTQGRIFDGNGHNWLSGFWSARSGVAFHNGWLNSTNRWNRNWVLSVDRKNWYRSYSGTSNYTNTGGGSGSAYLTIMWGNHSGETSDCYVHSIYYYNSVLSDAQVNSAVTVLKGKIGMA